MGEAKQKAQIGRLALRVDGNFWNAYYAKNDTMERAIFLGSLHMRFAQDPKRKEQFMDLMRGVVSDVLKEIVGGRDLDVTWVTQPAPEHERTKET